jgi:hypothetical protein
VISTVTLITIYIFEIQFVDGPKYWEMEDIAFIDFIKYKIDIIYKFQCFKRDVSCVTDKL